MPNDGGRPEPIGAALRRYLEQSGFAARVGQVSVLEEWPALVGAGVAEVTTPLSVSADGTLFVAVRSSAWMAELSLMEREILAALNRGGGREPITRIRWQLAR